MVVKSLGKRGRASLSELEKAYRAWIRAANNFDAISKEMREMMAVSKSEESSPRGQEIFGIADERIKLNRLLNPLNNELYDLAYSGSKDAATKKLIAEKKSLRSKIYAQLAELPDLGVTKEEWDDIDDDFKSKRLGRPKVSIELRLVRAEEAINIAEEEVRKNEKLESAESKTLAQVLKMFGESLEDAGRPAMKEIDKCDAEIRRLKILKEAALIEAETFVPVPHTGRGRPIIPPAERALEYQNKIDDMKSMVSKLEKTLDRFGKIDRAIKFLRRDYRELLKKREDKTISETEENVLEKITKEIDDLLKYKKYSRKEEDGLQPRVPYHLDSETFIRFEKLYK